MKPPVICLFVQYTCPEYPQTIANSVHFGYIWQHRSQCLECLFSSAPESTASLVSDLGIIVWVAHLTWCSRWLLDLRIICPNSSNRFCFKTCFNSTQHWTSLDHMRDLGPWIARILVDLLHLFLKFRVAKAAKISWLTMQNKAHWMLELLESATRLRVLAKLRRADRVPGGKKFCNAWDWRLRLSTDLASILAVAVHRQHSFGQVVRTLVL